MNYATAFQLVLPEAILILASLIVLGLDLAWLKSSSESIRRLAAGGISTVGCLGALWILSTRPEIAVGPNAMLADGSLIRIVKMGVLVVALLAILLSVDASFTPHIGEFYLLMLAATAGMTLMVAAENLLMVFVSLELTSLCLYVLVALDKRKASGAEAALKYFLFGGMAAAVTLYGFSLVYGVTGSLGLSEIAASIATMGWDSLLAVGVVMAMVGLGFKIAAAPFHLWAPDAYQAAPTACAAFIASGSKVAAFFLLAKITIVGLAAVPGDAGWQSFQAGWAPLIAVLACLSMVLGNLSALQQCRVKRLLAYSAIAHAGYALMGVLSADSQGLASVVYYALTYALTVLGAFGVVAIVERAGVGEGDHLDAFAGLSQRAPWLAFALAVFLLSLAGIPPLAGFFGKFYVFAAALNGELGFGLFWLLLLAVGMSAVSLYYYLQVLKQVYVHVPRDGAGTIDVSRIGGLTLSVLVVLVIGLGCMPDILVGPLATALP